MNLSNNKQNLIKLKNENKILRQKINTAKNFISSINYLYSDILLHKENRIVIDQKTFDLYKLNIEFVDLAINQIDSNSKKIIKLRGCVK